MGKGAMIRGGVFAIRAWPESPLPPRVDVRHAAGMVDGDHADTLHIRPACADDVDAAVPLIYSSGPPALDYVFARIGAAAQAFLRYAFVDGGGELGWRNHVVGEIGGQVVLAGSGFTHADAVTFTSTALRQIVRHFGWRTGGVIVRGLRTERVIRPPARGEFYIGHLGVDPAWRGHGFGTQLVEWLLREGRRRHRPVAALDVAMDNPRAQALYERLGFRVQCERASRLRNCFGAVAPSRRMRHAL